MEREDSSRSLVVTSLSTPPYSQVTHRWETEDQPDPKGVQLKALRELLVERPSVTCVQSIAPPYSYCISSTARCATSSIRRYVWYDYWCMYQGERTAEEMAEFNSMLARINLLYLGCTVL